MRIVNDSNKELTELSSILILLTPKEAKELSSKINGLDSTAGDHFHVNDESNKREITVTIYTPENMHYFSEDVRKVIKCED